MSDDTVRRILVHAETSYAGPRVPVNVNSVRPLKLESDGFTTYVIVRIRNYANDQVDEDDHEEATKYFSSPHHEGDTLSIQFVIKFGRDVAGNELKWGNDWDEPIRDILPWGFSAAFAAFRYTIDPGIEGDVYADKPWVYGPVLTSINYLKKVDDDANPETITGPIEEPDKSTRYSTYYKKDKLEAFTFKKGETYAFDFANPYLDMSSTPKIKMPGFTFDVGKYAGMTELRYVLKAGDKVVFALVFDADKGDSESGDSSSSPTKTAQDSNTSEPKDKGKPPTTSDSGAIDKSTAADSSSAADKPDSSPAGTGTEDSDNSGKLDRGDLQPPVSALNDTHINES